jgi:hypothetical protein
MTQGTLNMICARCENSGLRGFVLLRVWVDGAREWAPCPDCAGNGLGHCCEGDQCQPEPGGETDG